MYYPHSMETMDPLSICETLTLVKAGHFNRGKVELYVGDERGKVEQKVGDGNQSL